MIEIIPYAYGFLVIFEIIKIIINRALARSILTEHALDRFWENELGFQKGDTKMVYFAWDNELKELKWDGDCWRIKENERKD